MGKMERQKGEGRSRSAQKISFQRVLDLEGQDRKGELAEVGLTRKLGEGR